MTKKNVRYNWAVVNPSTGRLMRRKNRSRAVFRTRDEARMAAKMLGGKVVSRDAATEQQMTNEFFSYAF